MVVNQLYIDPTVTLVKGYVDPSGVAVEKGDDARKTHPTNSVTRSEEVYRISCSESSKEGKSKDDDHGEVYKTSSCLESNKVGQNTDYYDDDDDDDHTVVSADDMWESAMASPHMHGINERAEKFIAQFRAELRRQEIHARHLQ